MIMIQYVLKDKYKYMQYRNDYRTVEIWWNSERIYVFTMMMS